MLTCEQADEYRARVEHRARAEKPTGPWVTTPDGLRRRADVRIDAPPRAHARRLGVTLWTGFPHTSLGWVVLGVAIVNTLVLVALVTGAMSPERIGDDTPPWLLYTIYIIFGPVVAARPSVGPRPPRREWLPPDPRMTIGNLPADQHLQGLHRRWWRLHSDERAVTAPLIHDVYTAYRLLAEDPADADALDAVLERQVALIAVAREHDEDERALREHRSRAALGDDTAVITAHDYAEARAAARAAITRRD